MECYLVHEAKYYSHCKHSHGSICKFIMYVHRLHALYQNCSSVLQSHSFLCMDHCADFHVRVGLAEDPNEIFVVKVRNNFS